MDPSSSPYPQATSTAMDSSSSPTPQVTSPAMGNPSQNLHIAIGMKFPQPITMLKWPENILFLEQEWVEV